MPWPGSKVPRRMLITSPFSGSLLQSALPQFEQKHLRNPSGGWYSRDELRAGERGGASRAARRACAEAAVPVRRWQRVQWQYPAESGGCGHLVADAAAQAAAGERELGHVPPA